MMNINNDIEFPYSINDEPTDDWTIEELLKWCLLQSQQKTMNRRDEVINTLQELFDVGKKDILELQSQVVKMHKEQQQQQQQQQHHDSSKDQQNSEIHNHNQNVENQNPNHQEIKGSLKTMVSAAAATTSTTSQNNAKPTRIHIQITEGPYKGSTHTLKPSYKKPCWIGRSTSKKFRDRGISLSKDDEVSTTHGKFHITSSAHGSKFMFTDTGSTNGTVYLEEEIEDNVPLELKDGMILVIGNSHLLIHLI